MGQFEDTHIVKLHGVVTELQNTMIILEYMTKGDLQEVLANLKETYDIKYSPIEMYAKSMYHTGRHLKLS